MASCHECNSQVGENDVFCPFCGVKLLVVSEPSADELEVNSNATTEPSMTDIPIPAILKGVGNTSDNVIPEPTSEFTMDDEVERSVSLASEEITAEEPIPQIVDEEKTSEDAIPQIAAEVNSKESPAEELSNVKPGLYDVREVYADRGISRPVEELQEPEQPKSMFDSVRIMESKPPEEADTRIQGSGNSLPEAPVPSVLSEATGVEPKPYTEPSLGRVDTDGKRSAKLKPLTEGTILNGRYEIVRKIGGGGMGAVYLASDNNLGGVLRAVKEMVQSHIEEEQQEKAINDFKRESMILSTLDHPSIPTIYDYFYDADEGRFYLVMKYISGGDLSSRLRSAPEGKIDEKSITQWAIQITDVLDYLHNQPSTIVYRDLKPSNIMIDGNSGRIMLIDFGIARSISQKEEKGVTAVGTMGYAPPELFSGNVEPRSDVYSLGSTIFHLLTGADPQSNPLLIFDFQKNPRPRQINSQLSDQIERIIMRAVEYNSDARFASAAEMKAVLEEHLQNLKTGNVTYGVTAVPASISLENQSVFCGFCGQRIVATDLFCAFCGAKQPIAQQGVHSEIYTRSGAPTAKLIIEGTSELATPTFSLQKDENLVGRRDPMSNIFPEVDLSKYDPQTKISRRHARIWREGANFLVEDLGSSNGTVVASTPIDSFRLVPHKPHVLSSGDKLRIGDTTLHFLIG
jgi:serine/threonine-protein kinase